MLTAIREDIQSVLNRDPAAHSALEVLLCYQGLHAVWGYRIAHWFWVRHFYLIGRLISQLVRSQTGIESPGANDRAQSSSTRQGRGDRRDGGGRQGVTLIRVTLGAPA
jgi:hypothetical protein